MYQHIGFIVCCSYVSFVCILCFYPVAYCASLCSVVFLYSLLVTFCLPVLTSGPFFQCEALFFHLYLRHCPRFAEVLLSCCIKALSLFLYRGFVLIFYVEASSWYYIEALSSYFILRLWPRILF